MMKFAPLRSISDLSLRVPVAGLDSVSSVINSTFRPAMPPCSLTSCTAAFAALSCQYPQDAKPPVNSQWLPRMIGPLAWA